MRTQSVDTQPDVERIMIEMVRKASMSKRFRLVQSLTQGTLWANLHAWQENHQEASEHEAAIQFVSCFYDASLAYYLKEALDKRECWHIKPAQLMIVMLPTLTALDSLGVPYYIGGSLASSLYGMQQMAQDIDLIVDLHEHSLSSFLVLLRQNYVFDGSAAVKAAQERTSFSLIHLESLMKIDLILSKLNTFEIAMHRFITHQILDEQYSSVPIASAYEMILFKLQRYQHKEQLLTNGLQDDAEWNDILGMLKVQGTNNDFALLDEWARKLDIIDILHRALVDADLSF